MCNVLYVHLLVCKYVCSVFYDRMSEFTATHIYHTGTTSSHGIAWRFSARAASQSAKKYIAVWLVTVQRIQPAPVCILNAASPVCTYVCMYVRM